MTPTRLRRERRALLSVELWRRRAIFGLGAVAIGLAAILFAIAADAAQALFRAYAGPRLWVTLIVTPLGFALLAFLTRRWFDGAQGSGIPQAIATRHHADPSFRDRLLGLRVTAGKVFLTLAGLAVGGSIGREGPTVQVGAAIMHGVGRLAGMGRTPGLVLAGAAAGVAAAFNTPLAGIVFAIEEMAKGFERRINALVIAAVAIAGLVSLAILGDYRYFGNGALSIHGLGAWLAVPAVALLGGAAGAGFSRTVIWLSVRTPGAVRNHRVLFAGLCGLAVAVCGLATGGSTFGTGYETTQAILSGTPASWWEAPLKLVATIASSVAGIPGGLFSPSLSVGADLGAIAAFVLPGIDPVALAVLAMAAYFAGVVQAPLTAFVIVLELTAGDHLVLPLLTTTLLAAGVSRLLQPEPLYHALSRAYEPSPADKAP